MYIVFFAVGVAILTIFSSLVSWFVSSESVLGALATRGLVNSCQTFIKHKSADAEDMRSITIASVFGGHMSSWKHVQENHLDYAKNYGFSYVAAVCTNAAFLDGSFARSSRPSTWQKLALIQNLFNQRMQNLFWMDADSVFLNSHRHLRTFLSGADLVFDRDHNSILNAGHFMLRNTNWSERFLRDTYAMCPPPGEWDEQSAMMSILGGGKPGGNLAELREIHDKLKRNCVSSDELKLCSNLIGPDIRPHVQMVEQAAMNSYRIDSNELGKYDLPFIVHLAGRSKVVKDEALQRLAKMARTTGPRHRRLSLNETVAWLGLRW
mmetsp:Transcript_13136/g.32909  ORF Transcript_13136/g.32909 Transcript_13136/m.32909 type:complete len:322 (+) Transcript_13136:71-1036(+)